MLKIFTYVGNQRGTQSETYQIVDEFLRQLSKKLPIESVIFNSKDSAIATCQGCSNCFNIWGECRRFNDNLNSIIEEMKTADIIILASPVYVHNVTSDMKNFIDRLGVWSHLVPLSGKLGIGITYSFSNGNILVSHYLNKVLNYWGTPVIGNLNIIKAEGAEGKRSRINNLVEEVLISITNKESINFEKLEQIFELYRQNYEEIGKLAPEHPTYKYWKEQGYFQVENFEELFFQKNTINIEKLIRE